MEGDRPPGEYPDAKVRGLALRVSPAGGKSWTIRYRLHDGRQRRLTIGPYPALSLAEARTLAQQSIGEVAKGADPASTKQAAAASARSRRARTVDDLVRDYFADAEAGRHRPNARAKRASTTSMERAYYERLLKPKFGALPLDDLGRHDLQRFLDQIGEGSNSAARQCRNVIRQAYNYGIRREVVLVNPAQFVVLPASASRERVLTDAEVKTLWGAAWNPVPLDKLALSVGVGLAICLAMVTLQRGGEVIGLHAAEVDAEARTWTIPGARTKNHRTHVVPLSGLAMEVLDRAFSLNGSTVGDPKSWKGFAFPSPQLDGRPVTRHALSRAVSRLAAHMGVVDATTHDFRRTGSTNLTSERLGVPRLVVSRVLNQISDTGGAAAVTSVYDRNEYLPEKRKALDAWSALLSEIYSKKDE